MTRKLQILRGTTAQNNAYTGAVGELTMDTDRNEVRIHDGYTVGGIKIGGRNMPILTSKFFDHITSDMSWLRADTFSWHSGDVYKAAYDHLTNDMRTVYAWVDRAGSYGFNVYTKSATPSVGDSIYDENGSVIGSCSSFNSGSLGWTGSDGTAHSSWLREDSSDLPSARTETIGDITITYYLAQDGHKICLPDQESNIVTLYESTGVAWYYILDAENKQFKLPRAKPLNGAVVGNGMTLGLTNGTRNFGTEVIPTSSLAAASDIYGANISTSGTTGASGDAGIVGITTDPTKSGIIAERDNTDQHKYLYFYVGNFEQTAVEQTAGLNAELFNGKADRNLLNTTDNVDFVIESQAPTSANGYTWYRKYKSGWVEQGGSDFTPRTINAGQGTVWYVTLPVPMSDTKYSIQISFDNGNLVPAVNNNKQTTTTQVYLGCKNQSTGNVTSQVQYWQVSGMSQG